MPCPACLARSLLAVSYRALPPPSLSCLACVACPNPSTPVLATAHTTRHSKSAQPNSAEPSLTPTRHSKSAQPNPAERAEPAMSRPSSHRRAIPSLPSQTLPSEPSLLCHAQPLCTTSNRALLFPVVPRHAVPRSVPTSRAQIILKLLPRFPMMIVAEVIRLNLYHLSGLRVRSLRRSQRVLLVGNI